MTTESIKHIVRQKYRPGGGAGANATQCLLRACGGGRVLRPDYFEPL